MKKIMVRFMLLASIGAFVAIVGGCSKETSKKEQATATGVTIGAATAMTTAAVAGGNGGEVVGAGILGGIFGGLLGNAVASDDAKAGS